MIKLKEILVHEPNIKLDIMKELTFEKTGHYIKPHDPRIIHYPDNRSIGFVIDHESKDYMIERIPEMRQELKDNQINGVELIDADQTSDTGDGIIKFTNDFDMKDFDKIYDGDEGSLRLFLWHVLAE